MIKSFIIHLERAHARYAQVVSLRAALPCLSEIVNAVDAQKLEFDEMTDVYRRHLYKPTYPFALSVNEIACFLSHRKAWTLIVEQSCDAALILEDDASLGAGFEDAFALACDAIAEHGFIRLPHRRRERGEILAERGSACLIRPEVVGLGQVAYFLNAQTAAKLLASTRVFDRPVDVALQMFWLTKVRPLSILPSGIGEISAQIGGSTLHRQQTIAEKCRREILRPLYRWRLRRASIRYAQLDFMGLA